MKIDVLPQKHRLKDPHSNFKRVYLRSSLSHCERLLQLNMKMIIEELPSGNQYRITGNGRLVKKGPDSDILNKNINHEAEDARHLVTHQPQGMQSYNSDRRQGGGSRLLPDAGSNPRMDHQFQGYNYPSSTPRPHSEGIITHGPMLIPQVPNFNLSSMEKGSNMNSNSQISSILGPPAFDPPQRMPNHNATLFQTDSDH